MWFQIRAYSGDGSIRYCSTITGGGYAIRFPKFDPAHAYTASYRLSHLPSVSPTWHPLIYLRFEGDYSFHELQRLQTQWDGSVTLKLVSDRGRVLKLGKILLPSATLTALGNVFGFYDAVETRLPVGAGGNYTLEVTYDPGTASIPADSLFFELNVCPYY